MTEPTDIIPSGAAHTLTGLFRERMHRTPDAVAYREYDPGTMTWRGFTWAETGAEAARWQRALEAEGLREGDRVALMLPNRRAWVCFDQAAMGLGLVIVPLFTRDRVDNVAHVLRDSGATLLLIEGPEQWESLAPQGEHLAGVRRIVSLKQIEGASEWRLLTVGKWLPAEGGELRSGNGASEDLATIVYTSGTTGRPKGVMLSHDNILEDAAAAVRRIPVRPDDLFLSFLPLSHMFERTVGYYVAVMAGATVAFARSIRDLAEDVPAVRPTALTAVPLFFDSVRKEIEAEAGRRGALGRRLLRLAVAAGWSRFERRQSRGGWRPVELLWPLTDRLVGAQVRARLGGRLRIAVSGGAALKPELSRFFLGLGITVVQGYGLTEASPVISVNTPEDNDPESVGRPVDGIEVRLDADGGLEVRGPIVMLGYWQDEQATRAAMTDDGWYRTGDRARIAGGRIYLIGREKEIIVLANGEKVPPEDMEAAITEDPAIAQALVTGNDRPWLVALVVLDRAGWAKLARGTGLSADPAQAVGSRAAEDALLDCIDLRIHDFPGYARIRRAAIIAEEWTVDNGMMTPTRKLKRSEIIARYQDRIDALYAEGHRRR